MGTPAEAALWLLAPAAPVAFWAAWSDLKFMRIPNAAVLALAAVFLVAGPLALSWPDYLWRLAHLPAVLAAGFVLNLAGAVGAGDAKFAAAMAPFFALADAAAALMLLAVVMLAAFAAHRLARALPAARRAAPDWASWTAGREFPMGLALSGTLMAYLALSAIR
jgi:prepilin peptidase CpaA